MIVDPVEREYIGGGLWPVRLELSAAMLDLRNAIQDWTTETNRLGMRCGRLSESATMVGSSHTHIAKNARMLLKAVKGMAAWRHEFYQEPSEELKAAEARAWEVLHELEAGLRLLDEDHGAER